MITVRLEFVVGCHLFRISTKKKNIKLDFVMTPYYVQLTCAIPETSFATPAPYNFMLYENISRTTGPNIISFDYLF